MASNFQEFLKIREYRLNKYVIISFIFLICSYRKDLNRSNFKSVARTRPPRTKTAVCEPSTRPSVNVDGNLGPDRPSHGQIRTLDQADNFKLDEWTDSDDGPLKYKNVDGGGRVDRLTKVRP